MKLRRIIGTVFLTVALLCALPAWAANTINASMAVVEIIPDGSTDWDSATLFPSGMILQYIAFYPSAAGDIIQVRDGSATGPAFFKFKDLGGGGTLIYYGNSIVKPYFKASDCTFGTAANARIITAAVKTRMCLFFIIQPALS